MLKKLFAKLLCFVFGHKVEEMEKEVNGYVYVEPQTRSYLSTIVLIRYCKRCGKILEEKRIGYRNPRD